MVPRGIDHVEERNATNHRQPCFDVRRHASRQLQHVFRLRPSAVVEDHHKSVYLEK